MNATLVWPARRAISEEPTPAAAKKATTVCLRLCRRSGDNPAVPGTTWNAPLSFPACAETPVSMRLHHHGPEKRVDRGSKAPG